MKLSAVILCILLIFISARPTDSISGTKPIPEITTSNPYRDAQLMKLKYKILIIELQQEMQDDLKKR